METNAAHGMSIGKAALPPATFTARSGGTDERLRELIRIHFHPEFGSAYWLRRQDRLGFQVADRVRCLQDLHWLGPTSLSDLRGNPVRDMIPRAFHGVLSRFILGETAGTSGPPVATAYREDEFQEAFVEPFLRVVRATGFPTGLQWLWIGPSGPHIIGKAVRELARQTDCMDSFSVDFDPRWAKKLADGSTARDRYLEHVITQALDVLAREEIGVLFTTPPTLEALASRLGNRQRESIRGIHYGGMSLTAETVNHFRQVFPKAVHLAGYGNTLFGVLMEVSDEPREAMDYYPLSERVLFTTIADPGDSEGGPVWPPVPAGVGQPGRVMFHRLDETCLLANVVERDLADEIPVSAEAVALGATLIGLRNPRVPASLGKKLQLGLY